MAAAVCLVIGWAAAVRGQVQMNNPIVTVTEADAGRTINLRVGQSVAVTLPENATTGYRWAVENSGGPFVAILSEKPSYEAGAIGSGGSVTWTFAAQAPGAIMVTLKRWRHWEGDTSIVQRFQFELVITP